MAATPLQHPINECPEKTSPCNQCTPPSLDALRCAEQVGYSGVAKSAAKWAAKVSATVVVKDFVTVAVKAIRNLDAHELIDKWPFP